MNELQVTNYVTYKELVMIVLASSGILTLVFTIISRLFDKSSRVIIMDEIKKIDDKYQAKVEKLGKEVGSEIEGIKKDVSDFRFNYLERFSEQKDLIVENKEISQSNHSDVMNQLSTIISDLKHLKEKN